MNHRLLSAALLLLAAPAHAATLYTNGIGGGANCLFSSVCYTQDDPTPFTSYYVAEHFDLNRTAIVNGAGFSYEDFDLPRPSITVNWQLLSVDGAGGTPGSVIEAGSSVLSSSVTADIPFGEVEFGRFNVTPVTLLAGDYFLAFNADVVDRGIYLAADSAAEGGAYQSGDGAPWTPGYDVNGLTRVSLTVFGVPEPGSLAIAAAGFSALGWAFRKRAR